MSSEDLLGSVPSGPQGFALAERAFASPPGARLSRPALLDDPFSQLMPPSSRGEEPSSRRPDKLKGFVLATAGGEPLVCSDVRGFREASLAAGDARAPVPSRLILVAPEGGACAWLERWAEDAEQVRRTITISRRFDGKEVNVIATLSSHGYGIETSLVVDSVITARPGRPAAILRSGVHAIADVAAALARYDADLARESSTDPSPRSAPPGQLARVAFLRPRTSSTSET